jgi:molybdopterin synthase catalytic subunit
MNYFAKDALEACEFGIDELKATVPIWKKEYYEDGSSWKANKESHLHKC